MKRLLIIILPIVIFMLFVIVTLSHKSKISVDGKFGFVRDAGNIGLEKIKDTGATWFRPNFGYFVWGAMQKDESSPIDFSKTDEVVRNAQKHGLHL